MAYKHTTSDEDLKEYLNGFDYFWTVRNNVGYGYPNNPLDVLLVQFFLNAIDTHLTGYYPYYYGDNYIKEDGKFGGQTWARIRQFQRENNAVADGMVSAVRGGGLLSKKQKRPLTIYALNSWYSHERRQFYRDLKMDRDLPIDLCVQFEVPDF
ncbi:MAG: peptidoglycan-binding protein [Acidobacteria bacterium]|nr:peptidoglycan-binding protein [Acidobacteriota bacterium]